MTTFGDLQTRSVMMLLTAHGADAVITAPGAMTYATTDGTASGTPTSQTARVAFLNYRETQIDGQTIVRGDRKALIAAMRSNGARISAPTVGGTITGAGDDVRIVEVKKIVQSGVTVAYVCQVRE